MVEWCPRQIFYSTAGEIWLLHPQGIAGPLKCEHIIALYKKYSLDNAVLYARNMHVCVWIYKQYKYNNAIIAKTIRKQFAIFTKHSFL